MKSIMQTKKECYVCRKLVGEKIPLPDVWLEMHHIFGASNRKLSEKYGLKVGLCHRHHNEPPDGVHFNAELMQQLHEEGQKAFEKAYPELRFRSHFGKNYLQEEEKNETECN